MFDYDVLLLADVFENFRIEYMNSLELDLAHCLFTPGGGWDSELRYMGC